jgi:glucosamine-6-phosphate deaminase
VSMRWEIVEDYEALSRRTAELLLEAVAVDSHIVLGLPTGRTPEGLYARLVARFRAAGVSFREVRSFNLDEYVGIAPSHPGSMAATMRRLFFDHVDLAPQNIHLPDGTAAGVLARQPELDLEEALMLECHRYEEEIAQAGSLALTFLGLGSNGHIAFNEPGSAFDSRTRLVSLDPATRRANAPLFADGKVPERAITMGIATILESDAIMLLASGAAKAQAVARLENGPVSEEFPASALKKHPDVTILADRAAAALL